MAAVLYWKNRGVMYFHYSNLLFYLHAVVNKDTRIFLTLKMCSKSKTSQNKAFEQLQGASTKPDLEACPQLCGAGPRGNTVRVCTIWVLSSCTGSQEPLQRTRRYTTANQWLLNKERTMVIPLWTRTPGQPQFGSSSGTVVSKGP